MMSEANWGTSDQHPAVNAKVNAKESKRSKSPAQQSPAASAEGKCTEEVKGKSTSGPMSKKTAATVVVVGILAFMAYRYLGSKVNVKELLEKAVDFVEKQGNNAVWFYVLFTFVGVVCLVPTTPMEVAGGFLFHAQYGYWVYVFTGAAKLCANIVSVLIARFLVKDMVMEKVVKKSELLTMVAAAVKDEPWKMAFLVRGSMVPLFVKNYGLGVTDIGYLPNACCSMIFTNFYAAQNIYLGSTMKNLKDVFAPKTAATGPKDWTTYAKSVLPIIFNVLLVICLVKALKAQFKKQRAEIEQKLKKKSEKAN
jgi:uncharacterized membrane protein YdjX (TVP38/TMEM64 family)